MSHRNSTRTLKCVSSRTASLLLASQFTTVCVRAVGQSSALGRSVLLSVVEETAQYEQHFDLKKVIVTREKGLQVCFSGEVWDEMDI